MIKRIIDILLRPFSKNLYFFLALWVLVSAADVFFWSIHGEPVFGIYMGVHGYLLTYLIVIICGLLKGGLYKALKWILLALGVINLIADTCVHSITHISFTGDIVAIILGSNATEASEFLPMYFNREVISFIIACLVLVFLILLLEKRNRRPVDVRLSILMTIVLIAGLGLVCIRQSRNWEGLFLFKIGLFAKYEKPVDLAQYRSDPDIVTTGERPDNIVLIIGESLSKNHCSLYGYKLETTPLIDSLYDNSDILKFNNIRSAYTNTVASFKSMMSTYRYGSDNTWYKNIFMADIAESGGYESYWISNQSSAGIYDNVVSTIARLSDHTIWAGEKGRGITKVDLDECLIPEIDTVLENSNQKKLIIIHLMGQHESFATRYPESFSHFSEKDYMDHPENQRKTLCSYDNAVLYGDYVVKTIFDQFKDKEAIVLFFPDHSIDVYESDPTYIGHARNTNTISFEVSSNIPFIVYPTESYKNHFPDMVEKLRNAVDKNFNTEDIIYTFMDLANVKFADNDDVKKYSLLNKPE